MFESEVQESDTEKGYHRNIITKEKKKTFLWRGNCYATDIRVKCPVPVHDGSSRPLFTKKSSCVNDWTLYPTVKRECGMNGMDNTSSAVFLLSSQKLRFEFFKKWTRSWFRLPRVTNQWLLITHKTNSLVLSCGGDRKKI